MATDVGTSGRVAVEIPRARGLVSAIAWRNLWRNARRTWLTIGGIAFAVLLLLVVRSIQNGMFTMMIDSGTRLLSGHVQIQHPEYEADPSLRHTIADASAVARRVAMLPHVAAVGQRASAHALVSFGERSYGAQVMGVEPAAETALSTLPSSLRGGRYVQNFRDAVVGAGLARDLEAKVGDEIVVLGSTRDGTVAAMSATLVGVFETGIADVDRSVVQVPLPAFQEAFGLGDEAQAIVVRLDDIDRIDAFVAAGAGVVAGAGDRLRWLSWRDLMPEVVQMIQLKRVSTSLFFAILSLLVTFSAFNTFVMTVFERRREFGVLLAVGMKPARILTMVEIEALCLATLGIAIGLVLGLAIVAIVGRVGIPLGQAGAQLLHSFHLPDRLYAVLSPDGLLLGPILMLVVIPLAAFIPALRILRLKPIDAMRDGA